MNENEKHPGTDVVDQICNAAAVDDFKQLLSVRQPAGVMEQPLEPEAVMVKKEDEEEEQTGCSLPEGDHQAALTTSSSTY